VISRKTPKDVQQKQSGVAGRSAQLSVPNDCMVCLPTLLLAARQCLRKFNASKGCDKPNTDVTWANTRALLPARNQSCDPSINTHCWFLNYKTIGLFAFVALMSYYRYLSGSKLLYQVNGLSQGSSLGPVLNNQEFVMQYINCEGISY
jgi:hypothetical protein